MSQIFSTRVRRAAQLGGLLTTALLAFSCSADSPIDGSAADTGETTSTLTVDSNSRFVVRGPVGGPFRNGSRDYVFTNTGSHPVRWEASASEPWILFSDIGGIVDPFGSATVSVVIDGDYANTLPVGDYPAEISFATTSGADILVYFLLRVQPIVAGPQLTVTPATGFNPEGQIGGPITPDSKIYTLQNTGGSPLDWSAGATETWLTLSGATSGTLDPGAAASLVVGIDNNGITGLTAGNHIANLRFENLTDGEGTTERRVELTLFPSGGGRVANGLVALYNFDESTGSVVRDVSGVSGVDLTIDNTSRVTWNAGSLTLQAPTVLRSSGPATELTQLLTASNAATLELWIEPADLTQEGPARIFSLSGGTSTRNFTIGQGLWGGQAANRLDVRMRTTATDNDGLPSVTSAAGSLAAALSHVVYTRDAGGTVKLFVNGVQLLSDFRGGDLSNWDSNFGLFLGNEASGDRPWLGTFHLSAAYDRALAPSEVVQNFLAGPGNVDLGQLLVTPGSSLIVNGPEGGPFTNDRKTYTLENNGSVPINWTVSFSEPWMLSNSATTGSLAPSESTTVLVRVDLTSISAFSAGSYHGAISFVNETDGFGSTERDVSVNVQSAGGGSPAGIAIVPGDGFNGSTTQPGQIGSGPGANANAIANWDVVPYQDFTEDFNIGIVSFHINEIDRVEFSCEGGPWVAVNEMALNDRTGAVEYWGTLPAVEFDQDGLVEIRAIAYPTIGRPRLLQSMYLNCNVNGTLPSTTRWVSASGSDSADGSSNNPFKTIYKAASAIHDIQGGNAGGGVVYVLPGNYDFPGRNSAPGHSEPVTTTRWLTVAGAPGTSRNQVVMTGSDALLSKRVRIKDLKIRNVLSVSPANQPEVWISNVEMTQEGSEYGQSGGAGNFHPAMLRGLDGYFFTHIYQTDSYIHHTRMNNSRTSLERNILVEDILSQGFYNTKGLVVNSTVNGINASGTLDHPDMIHFQGYPADNLIFFNIQLVNCGAQGIFARNNATGNHYSDIAFVNVVIDNHPHYWQSDWSVATDHMLWWNVASPYQDVHFKSYEFPAPITNFSVRDSVFKRMFSPNPSVLDNNHFFESSGSVMGTNSTTGSDVAASFVAPDAAFPNYTPVQSSPIVDRVANPLVPVDIKNRPRQLPSSVGPYEKN
ncbi:MAG: hypothetical protein ACI8QZ_000564 [Chlamydiales bacterium]|jgi:hypothetical protein